MSKYEIQRWDAVMFGSSIAKVPMIYIKPDITFIDFVKANNYAVMCEINDTGTVYDDKQIPGVVDKSCHVPNCRPNFCEKTGFYVITLWSNWCGYPNVDKMGTVKFFGMKAPEDNSYSKEKLSKSTNQGNKLMNQNKNKGFDTLQIAVLSGVMFAILLSLFLIRKLFEKK